MKNKPNIAQRDDGFVLMHATWEDYSKLIKIANGLTPQNKIFYHPWLFRKNPPLKIKIGQLLARLSLLPRLGKLIKTLFPYGYAIILKLLSKDDEIVGIIAIYNFKKLPTGGFLVTHADMIVDKHQSIGLGSFQRKYLIEVAKQENVRKMWAKVHVLNQKSLSNVVKHGWKIVNTQKNVLETDGKKYDIVELVKEL